MNTGFLTTLLLIGFAPAAAQDPAPFKISVNVNLVVLTATVRDRKGEPVANLEEQDFAVFEGGVRQTVRLFRHEDIPVTVGLVVDHSGSMKPKLSEVTAAARTFVQSSNPQDRMFVINFNEKVTLGLPSAIAWSNQPEDLEHAISNTPARGMTALYDAVTAALLRAETVGHDKKVLVVISDGGDNASGHTRDTVLNLAGHSSALIYAIGIFDEDDPDRNPEVLRKLAHATGGEAFFPGKLEEVISICARIARDIRQQYTLGYVSAETAPPGAWRSIRVTAGTPADGKLVVRTRSGYIARGGQPPGGDAK